MKTYMVNLSPDGIGKKGLTIFTIAVISQIILYALFGLLVFFIGFVMFMVGGLFGRSVQKHYDKSTSEDMVGVSVYGNHRIRSGASILLVLPVLWVVSWVVYPRIIGYLYFPVFHLTGGEHWW